MATNYTTNYQLNQWEPADAVQRVEFNQDNAKVDAALKALSDQVVQKANQSAVNTLISAVNQKADASTVSDLSQTVASHTAQLAARGNCQIYYITYEGDGTGLEGPPFTMTFPHRPLLVMVGEEGGSLAIAVRGVESVYWRAVGASSMEVSWGEKSVSWPTEDKVSPLNRQGNTYFLVALLDVEE